MARILNKVSHSCYLLIFTWLVISVSIQAQNNETQFTLLDAANTGIAFENSLKDTKEHNILIYSNFYGGAGVGIGDFDNDGFQDIIFAGNQVGDRLYRNLGGLKFQEVTHQSGITDNGGWSSGVLVADVNNDGWLDIYICQRTLRQSTSIA